MKNIIKITLFLAIVAFLSGLSIGLVNSFTSKIIEKNAITAEKENLSLIFPNSEFVSIEVKDDVITSVYEVINKGYVFKASAKGCNTSSPIVVLIGMDLDGTIINVIPLEHQETNGVGSKCFEQNNIETLYVGKTIGQEVDVISGATFTSKAMKLMIAKAQEVYGGLNR